MSELFRAQAVEYQQQKLLGTIILRQGWSTQVLSLLFGALVCALIAVLFLFGFSRRETLSGLLLPSGGLVQASSPQSGLVQEVLVTEGQAVRQGDLLFVLSGERQGERGQTLRRVDAALGAQREQLAAQIANARRQADLDQASLTRKRVRLDAQLAEFVASIDLQRRRAAEAAEIAQRFGSVEYSTVVSREKLNEKQSDAIDQQLRLHALTRDRDALLVERDALQAELESLPVRLKRDMAVLQGSLSDVSRAEAENDTARRWEVRAPRDGRITLLAAVVGQSVLAGATLASVAPEGGTLEAVLYAPSRAAGQIHVGTPVQVRFDALPYQKYGQFPGEVHEVSRSPVPAVEAGAALPAGTPMFRIRVRLHGERLHAQWAAALKAGMQLDATLTLEHRRFYEWILEPIIGAKVLQS